MKTPLHISLESPDQPEVAALIEELDAYQAPLYPAESNHGIDIAALSSKNVLFAVGRSYNGGSVACGALLLCPMYVRIFSHRIAVDQAFPLEMKVPNAKTRLAMAEAEEIVRDKNARFESTGGLFDDLKKNSGE
ncbi:hypothetical protein [Pseudomonas sp. nanlin1]|uniref:hypothetical protein n=1 Tax=Pseudomonas sp. nanlin1 TaxID=3040605 RepID=UPI00388EC342